ncbi:thioredoxin TrxC [Jiella sp. M17.18]|uniref:thioredoxin TrxC n=1 Tax=Jiella sp. M17.18 TaxID=3234247 RepID=UPI0034DE60E8
MDRHIVCTHCGAVNRVGRERDADKAKCGSCHQQLFSAHPADVDSAMFDRQVGRGTIPVLVDVWAPWCGPCRAMAPAYEAAARELEPDIRLLKLNSDKEQQAAGRLGIRGIPTMILFHRGAEVARVSGAMSAAQIVGWVRQQAGKLAETA